MMMMMMMKGHWWRREEDDDLSMQGLPVLKKALLLQPRQRSCAAVGPYNALKLICRKKR